MKVGFFATSFIESDKNDAFDGTNIPFLLYINSEIFLAPDFNIF
jgi:hypothetical protein